MDYDLTRLGSREFEHLSQALAIQVLGPGVQAFGDGPDGGREADFRGKLNFPHPSPHDPWDGYGVLQAKFLQRPRDTSRDTAWLLGQLRAELRQWANPKSKRSRTGLPSYLLFSTNVVLSADPESGGIDLFERTAKELVVELDLPIREVRVWHYDQVCRYLDLYPGIRQTYSGLTTTGDVLFRLREIIEGTASELGELLASHSSKELATDQWVRLGQAGEADNLRLPLAELAIDPVATYTSQEGTQETVAMIRHILSHGDTVLRPSRKTGSPAHIAVIGGPGQGKSTAGQIVCQAYRVALLKDAIGRIDVETADIVTAFNDEMARMGLGLPASRRWPIRINLSEYADSVSNGEIPSILRYVSSEVSRRTPDVSPNQLRAWLRAWPWLVVLDGLDEVASTHAREVVMERVNDFLLEAASVDADLLVIATSRPQGYREEFSPRKYVHMRIEPLAKREAITYATQLTRMRHRGDPDTAERVLQRLADAAEEPLTSRLMSTPLQVTIMAILLERRERVPQQRYRLFLDYYQTIYNREASKPGDFARLIDEHRAAINYLHERVGLFLQAKSEHDGDSDAALHRVDISRIVEVYLHDEGFSYAEAAALAERIVDTAMRRLILLVPRKQESVGFDVRSLQEFMAARAIVTEDLTETCAFLSAIAGSAHWRNTWLLAAGYIFNERPAVRDRLVNLLDDIQVADELSFFLKPGSSLAVALISDDVAIKAPRFLRNMTKQALEILEDPLDEFETYDLCNALWNVSQVDGPSRQTIERLVAKNVAAGGHVAVNTLSTLGPQWEDATGSLAYQVRKLVEQARRRREDLALQLGSRILWPSTLVTGMNNGSIKTNSKSFWEVVQPYVDSLGKDDIAERCRGLFSLDSLGFLKTPEGWEIAINYNIRGKRRNGYLTTPGVVERLISVANAVPVELWMVRYQIRQILQAFQERAPVDFSRLASSSSFGDFIHFLNHRASYSGESEIF
ncbi:NACHT domain-containing protein [Streptomyces sp. NPDC002306]